MRAAICLSVRPITCRCFAYVFREFHPPPFLAAIPLVWPMHRGIHAARFFRGRLQAQVAPPDSIVLFSRLSLCLPPRPSPKSPGGDDSDRCDRHGDPKRPAPPNLH
jgi:hypothetical protein